MAQRRARGGDRLDLVLHDGNYLAPPGSVTTGAGSLQDLHALLARLARPPAARRPAAGAGHDRRPRQMAQVRQARRLELAPDQSRLGDRFRRRMDAGRSGRRSTVSTISPSMPRATTTSATCRRSRAVRACRRISISAKSRPATIWHAVAGKRGSVDTFLGELGWRDYAQNVILQLPDYRQDQRPPAARHVSSGAASKADLVAWQKGLHRLSDRRCRDAAIVDLGLDAQPGPDDRRQLPGEASADRLAARRAMVLGYAWSMPITASTASTGNGSRAAGSTPNVQPDHGAAGAVGEVRRRRLHPPLGARTGRICPTPTSTIRPTTSAASIPPKSSAIAKRASGRWPRLPRTKCGNRERGWQRVGLILSRRIARFATGAGWVGRLVAPAFARMLDRLDERLELGGIEATLPDGSHRRIGFRSTGPVAVVRLHNWMPLVRLATSGSVGWYKAWAAGEWSSPDPVPLFALFMANAVALGDVARAKGPMRLVNALAHRLRDNASRPRPPQHRRALRSRQRFLRRLARPDDDLFGGAVRTRRYARGGPVAQDRPCCSTGSTSSPATGCSKSAAAGGRWRSRRRSAGYRSSG